MNPTTQPPDPAQQYAEAQGAQVAHTAWKEGLQGTGRQASEELRLFPTLPAEDVRMFQTVAATVARDFDTFTGAPLKATVRLLLDSVEAHDDHQMKVSRELLQQLGAILEEPLALDKAAITVQNIHGGSFLNEMNDELRRGVAMLDAGGAKGEVKVKAIAKVKREGFAWSIATDVELTGGKTEKTQAFIRAQLDNGVLRPYQQARATAPTAEEEKPKKARAKKAPKTGLVPTEGEAPKAPAVGEKVGVQLVEDGRVTETVAGIVKDLSESGGVWVDVGNTDDMLVPLERITAPVAPPLAS